LQSAAGGGCGEPARTERPPLRAVPTARSSGDPEERDSPRQYRPGKIPFASAQTAPQLLRRIRRYANLPKIWPALSEETLHPLENILVLDRIGLPERGLPGQLLDQPLLLGREFRRDGDV